MNLLESFILTFVEIATNSHIQSNNSFQFSLDVFVWLDGMFH